jgi:hypothetical protein
MRLALPLFLLLGTLACESTQAPPATPACDLTLDSMAGKTFVMLEAMADKTEKQNPQARIKFLAADGKVTAKYTAKSLGNVYDYTCTKNSDAEFRCTTKADILRICLALEVHKDGSCTQEKITELGFEVTADEFTKAKADAAKAIAEAKAGEQWDRAKVAWNNVGNPIQGVLFAKIDAKRCRLSIDDMYYVVFDGKRKEDFNPVGTNPFVLDAEHDFVFEDCPNGRLLADLQTPELPANLNDIPAERIHEVGKDVHFFYVGDNVKTAEAGCTYSMDTYATWLKVGSAVPVAPAGDGKLVWSTKHAFTAEDKVPVGGGVVGGVFHIVRHKSCNGKQEIIDTVCAVSQLK